MIRVLHDPVTAMMIVGTGLQAVGQIASSQQAAAQKEAQATFQRQQAQQEQIADRREQEDIAQERARTLARTRAALASQGVDLSGGQAIRIQQRQAGEFAERSVRRQQDSRARRSSLRARASNLDDAASATRTQGFLNAAGTIASGGQSLLSAPSRPQDR